MATIVAARVQAKASRFGDASVICLATVVSVLSPMRNMSGAAWRAAGSIWHESRTSRARVAHWLECAGGRVGGRCSPCLASKKEFQLHTVKKKNPA